MLAANHRRKKPREITRPFRSVTPTVTAGGQGGGQVRGWRSLLEATVRRGRVRYV